MKPKPPPKYRIFIMMASNLPQALDEALLRPGRIDRIYKVGYPNKPGRLRTYEGYFAKVSHRLSPEQMDKLATITPYATGATIKDLVNEALVIAIRDGRESIEWQDVLRAKQLKELGLPDDTAGLDRERYETAIHEACHAVASYARRTHLEIDLASIERRGDTGGMVAYIRPEDQMFSWRSEYEADLLSMLASLAGERLFFDGDNTNGVGGDLGQATRLATMMEGYWGMGSTVASHGVQREFGVGGGGGGPKPEETREDELLRGALGQRIEANLARLLHEAEQLITENRAMVLALAHAMLQHKTISGEDVNAVFDGTRGPLVDGAWYHTDAFRIAAERYHEAAMAAHRAKRPIEAPLPLEPVPVRFEAVPVGVGLGNGAGPNGGAQPPVPPPVTAPPPPAPAPPVLQPPLQPAPPAGPSFQPAPAPPSSPAPPPGPGVPTFLPPPPPPPPPPSAPPAPPRQSGRPLRHRPGRRKGGNGKGL
jgi:hypothetical protein